MGTGDEMSDNLGYGMAKSLFAGVGCIVFFFIIMVVVMAFVAGMNYHQ